MTIPRRPAERFALSGGPEPAPVALQKGRCRLAGGVQLNWSSGAKLGRDLSARAALGASTHSASSSHFHVSPLPSSPPWLDLDPKIPPAAVESSWSRYDRPPLQVWSLVPTSCAHELQRRPFLSWIWSPGHIPPGDIPTYFFYTEVILFWQEWARICVLWVWHLNGGGKLWWDSESLCLL